MTILEKVIYDIDIFQHVNVALLDPLQHHVAQVEHVLANQMLLVPNVLLVSLDILDFPTANVKILTF